MKGIRTAVIFLAGVIYASLVWATIIFAHKDFIPLFVILLAMSTAAIVIGSAIWIAENWNN